MTRPFLLTLALVVATTCAGAQTVPDDASSPKLRVGWTEFKKLYDEGKVVVVDVRDCGSFEAGHIPKARCVPLNEIEARTAELKKLKLPIVTYCA
jgi:3-mercaptopyruvate sulfurtransferase SseA